MNNKLPSLIYEDLLPTRDYLREVALILSRLQRAYIPKNPKDWQYGLEVNLRGLITQSFELKQKEVRASLDLVRQKVRLGNSNWSLDEYSIPEIINNIKAWLESRDESIDLLLSKDAPVSLANYSPKQAKDYSLSLWWMEEEFRHLKASLRSGLTSPILLYPHHFDLSLVWFPFDDHKQLALGYSTGDQIIKEPYLYLTAYPEPTNYTNLKLPDGAYWQKDGFSGAILPYSILASSKDPRSLFKDYAHNIFDQGTELFS